jgi:hypothetical protein
MKPKPSGRFWMKQPIISMKYLLLVIEIEILIDFCLVDVRKECKKMPQKCGIRRKRGSSNGVRMCTSRKLDFFHPSSFCFRTCYIVNLVELQALHGDSLIIWENLRSNKKITLFLMSSPEYCRGKF